MRVAVMDHGVVSRVFLIRHGQTEANRAGKLHGRSDLLLNDQGRRQMTLVAERLSRVSFDEVLTSPEPRALASASFFGEGATVAEALRELDWGAFDGLSWAEVHEKFPDTAHRRRTLGYEFSPPQGESGKSAIRRAMALLAELVVKNRASVCVTHGGLIRLTVCSILGVGYENIGCIGVENGAFTELLWTGKKWKVVSLNCTP